MSRLHLITTEPTLSVCSRCHRPVLAATIGGLDWQLTPAAVTPEGELQALLAGMSSFELRGLMASLIIRRGPAQITAGAKGPVLLQHTCHEIPDQFVDCARMEAAMYLVCRLLGATPVVSEGNTPPPF